MSDDEYDYGSDADDDFQYESDGGEYDGDVGETSIVHARKDVQWMNLDDLNVSMNKIIVEVQECVSLSPASVAALLRHFNWNKEKLFDEFFKDASKVQEDAGIISWSNSEVVPPTEPIHCRICYSECSGNESMAAPCGHFFCTDCYSDYLSSKVNDGPAVIFTKCPEHKCPCLVPPEMFLKKLEGGNLAKFQKYTAYSYVDLNKSIRWCPGVECVKAVRALPGTLNVKCKGTSGACGTSFCFKCGEDAHEPASCDFLSRWTDKCQNESETANWILAHTKRCPNGVCNTRIEKNQGCNHMTCKVCKHEFCWICMGPWSEHGTNTGGYYSCNRFDAKKSADSSDTSKAKKELDRYLHYYKRYHNHHEAQAFAKTQSLETPRRMEEYQATSKDLSWIDVQFLKSATDMLIECRRVLKYTYVFGFYLSSDAPKRGLFEDQQEQLESFTEKLSELTEMPIEEIDRTEVINYTMVTEKFMLQILQSVRDGLMEVE